MLIVDDDNIHIFVDGVAVDADADADAEDDDKDRLLRNWISCTSLWKP